MSSSIVYLGIEQDPIVTALAIVNMIFRNDGKNHIH